MSKKEKPEPWTMPVWMERYRSMIVNTGGNSVEDMMNGNADPIVNLPLSTLQACVKSQVAFLQTLQRHGKLFDDLSRVYLVIRKEGRDDEHGCVLKAFPNSKLAVGYVLEYGRSSKDFTGDDLLKYAKAITGSLAWVKILESTKREWLTLEVEEMELEP